MPSFQEVEEEYTLLTDPELPPNASPEATFLARSGQARATLKVPVKGTRKVVRPVTVIQEVDDWAEVEVPASRVVEVDGFRVDEVEDTKVVEIEEVQHYKLQPVPVGAPQIKDTHEVGRLANSRLSRTRGTDVFAADHPALDALELDSEPDFHGPAAGPSSASAAGFPRAGASQRGLPPVVGAPSFGATQSSLSASALARTSPFAVTAAASLGGSGKFAPASSFYRPNTGAEAASPFGQYDRTGYADPKNILPAGSFKKLANANGTAPGATGAGAGAGVAATPPELVQVPSLGVAVKNTHTRHTDGVGVYITKVERGSPAARAGLLENDLITAVQGQSTTTVDEFTFAVAKIPGPLVLQINRDGRRNLAVTLYR